MRYILEPFFLGIVFYNEGFPPLKFVSFPTFNTSRKKPVVCMRGKREFPRLRTPNSRRNSATKRETFQDSLLFPFSYCTVFELVRVTKACRNDKDFFRMQKGEKTTENEKNERMVTFRFGVKSPILPMNENSHLFRQIYERRLVFAQSLGFKKILSALPIEGGGEPLAELLKFLPYHRPPPFQSAHTGGNTTNNDEDLNDSRRRKEEEDPQKRSHHHHRPMCEITRLAGFALAGNRAKNRTKKGVWRLGRWPQDEGAISDAKNGVTQRHGREKSYYVTTLYYEKRKDGREERGEKSFL